MLNLVFQDEEFVCSYVKNRKGTKTGISNADFSEEIEERLYPILKNARQNGQWANFEVDKIIINVQVYRADEKKDLQHYGAIM